MEEKRSYDKLSYLELDTLRELGSVGTGNAATALSELLGRRVSISLPEVRIMGYNEAIDWIGGPEAITAGVLVKLSGGMNGIVLSVQQLEFINLVLENMLDQSIPDYSSLREIEASALLEVGNIMISTFINALSAMTETTINLTVPAITVDMQGAILTVPMAEYGGQSDYIMTIGGNFTCEGRQVPCRLLLSPDIDSLTSMLQKLGVTDGQ